MSLIGFGHVCSECGEFMPVATENDHGQFLCADCSGTTRYLMEKTRRHFPAERSDIEYHGGLFHGGEW